MRRVTHHLPAAILVLLAGLILAGCHSGSGEVRYVNRTNSTETLTLNRSKTVKTKVIYTFHGIATGTYTLKTDKGTTSGSFSDDGQGIKFRPENGEPQTVKFKSDGSFDYANASWAPVPVLMEKGLKAIASSAKEGAAQ